ncbi:hypothetical protein HYH03_012634 [Edaphochlamys debaryana]|uniref:Uncharacterized protein n=1 Tax=Edaphochlamys debaryana TaxID=47281 RepID=A0A835XRN3_9CHLO|nr:hypothetical protein HYH03_012634 [Edaphochlamys debaryana]|eukprot:KAG2488836.1 hypothetical protein HYH03_012634 [Edaphochlamys debaryana]
MLANPRLANARHLLLLKQQDLGDNGSRRVLAGVASSSRAAAGGSASPAPTSESTAGPGRAGARPSQQRATTRELVLGSAARAQWTPKESLVSNGVEAGAEAGPLAAAEAKAEAQPALRRAAAGAAAAAGATSSDDSQLLTLRCGLEFQARDEFEGVYPVLTFAIGILAKCTESMCRVLVFSGSLNKTSLPGDTYQLLKLSLRNGSQVGLDPRTGLSVTGLDMVTDRGYSVSHGRIRAVV